MSAGTNIRGAERLAGPERVSPVRLRNHLIFNEGLDADMIRKLGGVLT